jgi:prolyl oligopeptidase
MPSSTGPSDRLHGHDVPDPYRWLEDAGSPECEAWSEAQDAACRGFLDGLPGRDRWAARLRALLPGSVGLPTVIGERYFFERRSPEQELPVYLVQDGASGVPRALIDPVALDPSATTIVEAAVPSKEGDRVAVLTSEGGREDDVLRVVDVATGAFVGAPVLLGRGGMAAWLPGGEELIVVRRLADVPAGEEQFHRRVWRHRVGTDPADDVLLFGEGRDKTTYYGIGTSRDGRWLWITTHLGTAPRNDAYLVDLASGGASVAAVAEGEDAQVDLWVSFDGSLYVFTDLGAPSWRLLVADPTAPREWRELLAESADVLRDVTVTGDAVVAVRSHDVVARMTVHDKSTGAERAVVPLPGLGTAVSVGRPAGGDDVWISYQDFVTPPTVFHYSVASEAFSLWASPPGAVSVDAAVSQVFFTSADGTRVPMFVIAGSGAAASDEPRPTILYGYGGFNIALEPEYRNLALAWVEAGGVFAIANLRGGSEYGEAWHRDGMRDKKQNVFDDFAAAAEWLVSAGWTSFERLGIYGGSNGGLLVGAALTQRPSRYRAVVCSAPLLDMIRYELFGLGQTWNDEYGRASDPAEFEWLWSYSPYHRAVLGGPADYPAVLFTVFEGDTRVDPLHARKTCAALQEATTSGLPVLIRRETNVGHSTRAVSRTIGLQVDQLAFFAAELGLPV